MAIRLVAEFCQFLPGLTVFFSIKWLPDIKFQKRYQQQPVAEPVEIRKRLRSLKAY